MARNTLRRKQAKSRGHSARRADPAKYLLVRARARARKQNLPCTITIHDIDVPDRCPVFGTILRVGGGDCAPSLDRILPELGYVRGNIIVISNRANRIKSNATLAELHQLVTFLTRTLRSLHG